MRGYFFGYLKNLSYLYGCQYGNNKTKVMLEKLIIRLNELNQDEWDFDGWSSKDILIFAHQTICDEFNKDYDDEQFETLFHQAWDAI